MHCKKITLLVATCAVLMGAAAPSHADWAVPTQADIVKPYPDALQSIPQNPPGFKWARYPHWPRATAYVLEVRKGNTVVATHTTTRNMWLPSSALATGIYTWRVRPSHNNDWSSARMFIVDASSKTFIVPEVADLRSRVLNKSRSRALPSNFATSSTWSPEIRAQRQPALDRLLASVKASIPVPVVSDAAWTLRGIPQTAAQSAQFSEISSKVGVITNQVENATVAYRVTGDVAMLNEAIKRGDELTMLDPTGATGYETQDQVSRQIALVLAKGLDMMWNKLDAQRRAKWLATIRARMIPLYTDLAANNGRMDQYPLDSHGQEALGFLALTSTLVLGEVPEADQWFDFSVRNYAHSIFAWSGPEGGFANGSAYGQFLTYNITRLWPHLKEATGLNLYEKPWSLGFANWMMHFLPPGAPGHVFGDQHETPLYPEQLKEFVTRLKTKQAAWYAANLTGTETPLSVLLQENPVPSSTVAPEAPPNAAVYPSIGWVAMHSDIKNRNRTSVYFRSSPYGTYNHSHGDNNGLVIDSAGKRLLIEAGYQDYFASPLGSSWYRQTKAHNSVTFDGGTGQLINDGINNLTRTGKITAFSTSSALDYTEGDATAAYGGLLTSFTRKVWYLRGQDAVVVRDSLTSTTARSFEWNMHGAGPMLAENPTSVKITNGTATLCLRSLTSDGRVAFQTRTGAAPQAGKVETHGAFVRSADQKAEFIVLLDVGCKRPSVSLTTTSTGRTLKVGTQSILLPR